MPEKFRFVRKLLLAYNIIRCSFAKRLSDLCERQIMVRKIRFMAVQIMVFRYCEIVDILLILHRDLIIKRNKNNMGKTVIVYGSSTGTCQELAEKIGEKLGLDSSNIINVADMDASVIADNANLILGTSTWGSGEMQDDWYDGVKVIKENGLAGKTVALFGCGDCESYCDTFCGGMAELHAAVEEAGAKIIGGVAADGYNYEDSEAVVDGKFVGLALDEVNESQLTDERIDAWVAAIQGELA